MVSAMLKNDFIVKISKSSLTLKADPSTIRDIAAVLEHLVNMVHLLKIKAEHAEKKRARLLTSRQIEIDNSNQTRAREIYERFLLHLKNGCEGNKAKALQEIKNEYKLLSVDAKFFISKGRQIANDEKKKMQYTLF